MNEAMTNSMAEDGGLAEVGRLLVLLYAETIDGLHAAAEAAEAGEIENRLNGTIRASEALCRLHLGLDHERGGEIAANLDRLYRFIQSEIPQINLRNDAMHARRLASLLEPLLDSWTEVVDAETAKAPLPLMRQGSAQGAETLRATSI